MAPLLMFTFCCQRYRCIRVFKTHGGEKNSRQFSSSDPSLQSVSPSQYQCSAMQLPSVQRNSLSEHLRMSAAQQTKKNIYYITARLFWSSNVSLGAGSIPHCSSLLSPQSLSPSQCHRLRMQYPFWQ